MTFMSFVDNNIVSCFSGQDRLTNQSCVYRYVSVCLAKNLTFGLDIRRAGSVFFLATTTKTMTNMTKIF